MSAEGVIEIRVAKPEQRDACAELIFDPPGPEMESLFGGEARARHFGLALLRAGVHPSPELAVYGAFAGERAVGVLAVHEVGEATSGTGVPALTVLPIALRLFWPWELPGLAHRAWLRSRLDFPLPTGALHVVEVHVAPERRGQGIGGRLLEHAERIAREARCERIVLSTLATNPARRLYERQGFRVTAERSVRGYRRITGSPGRVFMEKLTPAS